MDIAFAVGSLAAICSAVSFAPQAWKIIKSRDTSSISLTMYGITVVGFALWLTYGIMLAQWPLVASNAICLALSSFILWMKVAPKDQKDAVAAAIDPEA